MIKFTTGKQLYILKTDEQYIGYYHEVRGRLFTGKRYVFKTSRQLYKRKDQIGLLQQALPFKDILNRLMYVQSDIEQIPYPILWDGEFTEIYILKQKSNSQIYDVNKKTYSKFKNHPLFDSWHIRKKNYGAFQKYSYNKSQLRSIQDNTVVAFLQTRREM